MDREKIDALLKVCGNTERAALTVMWNAYVKHFNAYKEDDCKANLAEWRAAEKALRRMMDDLESRAAEEVFRGVPKVVAYLNAAGYKVRKSKIYQDIKDGLLRAEADGRSYRSGEVLAYAVRAHLKQKADEHGALDSRAVERAGTELEILRIKRDREEFELAKLRGEYIKKSDVIVEFSGKLALLEAGVKHAIRTYAGDWVVAVGGDAKKADLLYDMAAAEVDALLTALADLEEIGIYVRFLDIEGKNTEANKGMDG